MPASPSYPATWVFLCRRVQRIGLAMLCGLAVLFAKPAVAAVVADWGAISTPITSPVTFAFAQYDVRGNFTHEYVFTLEGSADATYSVSLQFDACRNGCGNPILHYGIGGSLSESGSGSYVLAPGTYSFTVAATGMGAGNSVDYWGEVVIAGGAGGIVAPVPEPEVLILAVPGAALVLAVVRRRRARERAGDAARAGVRTDRAARAVPAVVALAAPLLLSACSGAPPEKPTQVMARVGSTEISALQLDLAMRLQRGPGVADRQQVLDKLIDRELAVQQALARKLDRQPEVLLRLEELRREILSGAYAEQVAAARPRPSEQAVRAFYADNPELFAQRKIYRLRELVIPVNAPQLAQVRERLTGRQPLAEIVSWLGRENATFTEQDVLRAAEQVPLEAVRKLHALGEGQTAIFEAPQALYVYQLIGFQSAPLDPSAAAPLIASHLARQDGERAMRAELKALRASADIEIIAAPPSRAAAPARAGG